MLASLRVRRGRASRERVCGTVNAAYRAPLSAVAAAAGWHVALVFEFGEHLPDQVGRSGRRPRPLSVAASAGEDPDADVVTVAPAPDHDHPPRHARHVHQGPAQPALTRQRAVYGEVTTRRGVPVSRPLVAVSTAASGSPDPAGASLRLDLLGGFRLRVADRPVVLPTHAQRVLAYLSVCTRADAGCSRATIGDRLL